MRSIFGYVSSTVIGISLLGCASVPPQELVDARAAYRRASAGPAAQVAPSDLHKARECLSQAEQAFADSPDAQTTRDLAYVAERRAELAEALASQAQDTKTKGLADEQLHKEQALIQTQTTDRLNQTKEQLAASQRDGNQKSAELVDEKKARASAEDKAAIATAQMKSMSDALAKLAAVKEEERGLVITLSGSVLFASDGATLLPDAQTRLNQVSDALLASKERNLTVEGHTDSKGSVSHNVELSQRRAEAVRSYLVSRGYSADLVEARGIGQSRPIADNGSAEGRANNRRVEIIVQPRAK